MLLHRLKQKMHAELPATIALASSVLMILFIIVASMSGSEDGKNLVISSEAPVDGDLTTTHNADSTKTSKHIADELLEKLLKRIGRGMGPLIVGGIGDSGTRGVRDVLIQLGAQMLGEGYVHPVSKDSEIYMDSYPTVSSQGKTAQKNPPALYKGGIEAARSLIYNESILPFDYWHMGRQYVAKMVERSMTVSEKLRKPGEKLDPWGFKHPRTAWLLPFWRASLGDKFVFIHVLRDGKDIIENSNQKVFYDLCSLYYGKKCSETLRTKINFWADVNREVFRYVLESDMKADQYIAIRIEDLVLGNEPCFKRLAQYLRLSSDTAKTKIPKAIAADEGHESSYLGHKWSADLKAQVENAMVHDDHVKADFEFWGYKVDDYKLTRDCESLAWMDMMRKKKGPLPGDGR